MQTPRFPPRIHVLLARDVPLGLVIRRGPSKCVATFLWNRESDSFQLGQWFKGRIYERRCDLSPDGQHFLYYATKGKSQPKVGNSWTAISRAPYLKALALFPNRDCRHGGGLWTGIQKYRLIDGYGHTVIQDTQVIQHDLEWQPSESLSGNYLSVYYPRLIRDGWGLREKVHEGEMKDKAIFEKSYGDGWILRKIAHDELVYSPGRGYNWDEHELVHPPTNRTISFPEWEWADVDDKRLVWATAGKLACGSVSQNGLSDEKTLFDFNGMTFSNIKAPY